MSEDWMIEVNRAHCPARIDPVNHILIGKGPFCGKFNDDKGQLTTKCEERFCPIRTKSV